MEHADHPLTKYSETKQRAAALAFQVFWTTTLTRATLGGDERERVCAFNPAHQGGSQWGETQTGKERGDTCRGRTQKQIHVRLERSPVEFALNPVERFEPFKSSLCVFGELLHGNELLRKRREEEEKGP